MQFDDMVAVINTALEGRRVPHVLRVASQAVRIRTFTPSDHSSYQANLLLIMTNIEIAKTESLGVRIALFHRLLTLTHQSHDLIGDAALPTG